jgi:hypothetical protein
VTLFDITFIKKEKKMSSANSEDSIKLVYYQKMQMSRK